jgi:hypothetical protein
MSENTINAALRNSGFDGNTIVGHGFRAMARTVLDEVLGFSPTISNTTRARGSRSAGARVQPNCALGRAQENDAGMG